MRASAKYMGSIAGYERYHANYFNAPPDNA
jgi:hypothetical protein